MNQKQVKESDLQELEKQLPSLEADPVAAKPKKQGKSWSLPTSQIMAILLALMAGVFAYVGINKYGFWDDVNGPMPGFFPSNMALVMMIVSLIVLVISVKDKTKSTYYLDELFIIGAVIAIMVATMLIGLIPSVFIFVFLWIKVFERLSWKTTIIVLLIVAFIALGVFGYWLEIQFPWGLLENFM